MVAHRHLAAHVRLNNHARLHSLLMGVLGQLVDYAGLWERDLCFSTLALISLQKKRPQDNFFIGEEREALGNGRIVDALKKLKKRGDKGDASVQAIFCQLKRLFGANFLDSKKGLVSIRNDSSFLRRQRRGRQSGHVRKRGRKNWRNERGALREKTLP